MSQLVFWGEGDAETARRHAAEDARFVLWLEGGRAALETIGIAYKETSDFLSLAERDRIDEAAMAWTKAFGKRPLLEGRSLRELLDWKGVSLWWFAELYLHHSTSSPRYVRLIESFHTILDAARPASVTAIGLPEEEVFLLARTCARRGIPYEGPTEVSRHRYARQALWKSRESQWNTVKSFLTALKATVRPRPVVRETTKRTVLFFSHAAFWRERRDAPRDGVNEYELYFDRLIPEVARQPELQPFVVAVGPRAAHRRRGVSDRFAEWLEVHETSGHYVHMNRYSRLPVFWLTLRATREIRRAWRRLEHTPALWQGFAHRGVSFAELAEPDFAGTLLLQLPWAVRSYEEMAAALKSIRPAAVCLYAESSGWGRAATAACRAAGVATLAVQHGILYPKYYSYIHAPDEADCPRPDRTALFGEAALRLLLDRGHYAPEGLVVTGSPKFDALLEAAGRSDRKTLRAQVGVSDGERLVVVASRYRGIRQTHQSIGSAFPALVRAIESLPGVRCLVKPHPAERGDLYADRIREAGATRVGVLPASSDLFQLLHAADVLVTVESLSAIEALVLDRPVLVLNMPTNLREMVDKGAALGVPQGGDPQPALHDLLFDPGTRERLERGRRSYLADVAKGVDGQATARIVTLIREAAARPARPRGAPDMVGC